MLTYLDDDTLIGRAQQGAGTFVFKRVEDNDLTIDK